MSIWKNLLVMLLALGLLSAQDRRIQPIVGARQVALVIGNSRYASSPLKNPAADARAVSQRLTALGFQTDIVLDADRRQLASAIDRFTAGLRTGDVALFYYSGHGAQLDGENYLIPVDYTGQAETDLHYDSYPAAKVQERMERSGSRLNIVILDACRNNPFRTGSRAASIGLAPMSAARGTFVALATSPGQTASDNAGEANGLFTKHLLQALDQPGLGLDDVFNLVRERVDAASAGRQLPWTQSSVVGRFEFVHGNRQVSPEAPQLSNQEPVPVTLDPKQRILVVHRDIDVMPGDGTRCGLTMGDILLWTGDTPVDGLCDVSVLSSKPGDCAVNSPARLPVKLMVEMQDHFRQQLDHGVQELRK